MEYLRKRRYKSWLSGLDLVDVGEVSELGLVTTKPKFEIQAHGAGTSRGKAWRSAEILNISSSRMGNRWLELRLIKTKTTFQHRCEKTPLICSSRPFYVGVISQLGIKFSLE